MKKSYLLLSLSFFIPSLFICGCIPSKIAISKNGKVAFQLDSKRIYNLITDSSDSDIYLTDTKGSYLRRLTANEHYDGWPDFSPDESSLVFVSHPSKKWQLNLINLKTEEVSLLYENSREIHNPTFSPNGELVAFFSKSSDSSFDIEFLEIKSKKIISKLERVIPYSISWSQDSRYVIIVRGLECSNAGGLISGYIGTFDVKNGKETEKIVAGFFKSENLIFHTRPDTKELVFSAVVNKLPLELASEEKYQHTIYQLSKSGKGLKRLSPEDKSAILPNLSPDANKIVWIEADKSSNSRWGNVCVYDLQNKKTTFVAENTKGTYPQWVNDDCIIYIDIQNNPPHIICYDLNSKKKSDLTWEISRTTRSSPDE